MVKQLLTVLPYPLSHLTRVLISSAADFIYLLIQMNKCPAPPAGKQSLHFLYPPLRIRPNGHRHYIALYIMYCIRNFTFRSYKAVAFCPCSC